MIPSHKLPIVVLACLVWLHGLTACGDSSSSDETMLGDADIGASQAPQVVQKGAPLPVDVPAGSPYRRFANFDPTAPNTYGLEGILPPNEELADVYKNLNESERRGLAVWHLFAAERGDFWRTLQLRITNGNNILRLIDSRRHETRFEETGILNDPDCEPATTPDEFGLYIADCPRDPYSSGVIGLRLRPNPRFDMRAWLALGNGNPQTAAERWLRPARDRFEWQSARYKDIVAVEPPYETAMSCTVCHAAPNPLNPPLDPNHATWKEIVFGLGNQYFKESQAFIDGTPADDFIRHIVDAQEPGTSDTSRIATDHIFNPSSINAIFNLAHRPKYPERVPRYDRDGIEAYNADIKPETCDDDTCEVDTFRVLNDGADSSGVTGAVLRVFINVGSCYSHFRANMDPVWGIKHPNPDETGIQTPISRRKLEEECRDYQRLLPYTEDLFAYLQSIKPYRLADVEGGRYVKRLNDPQMIRGATVFADNCATCHSSAQPSFESNGGKPSLADTAWEVNFARLSKAQQLEHLRNTERRAWFRRKIVPNGRINPQFFASNFLADDRRYPVSLLETHAARSLGNNAQEGHIWAEYSSVDYRDLPPVSIPKFSHVPPFEQLPPTVTDDGGYHRTTSLWGIWTSAPFLHNNSVGLYNGGVSVEARLAAYNDGMRQLLSRQRIPKTHRTPNRFVYLTTVPVRFDGPLSLGNLDLFKLGLPIPPRTPVAMVGNLELNIMLLTNFNLSLPILLTQGVQGFFGAITENAITAFDPVENRGHYFGADLSETDKAALIEFLKWL